MGRGKGEGGDREDGEKKLGGRKGGRGVEGKRGEGEVWGARLATYMYRA